MKKVDYSVVIPTFNSEHTLPMLCKRIHDVFTEVHRSFEIIFVDDCSPNPNTKITLIKLAKQYSFVKVISLTRNFGQQSATICGFEHSAGDHIITMDDDLQHQPEYILELIKEQHHDLVIARLKQRKDPILRKITSYIKSYFDYYILKKPKHIRLSPFRLMKGSIVKSMLEIKTPTPFIPALMFYVTKDVVNVPIIHEKRKENKSNYTFMKRLKLFSLIIINNSSFLLKLIGYLGLIIALFSILLMFYYIIFKWSRGDTPMGWASTISAILFLGGMTLFSLGIIGEYLIRIMPAIERKPTYIIKEKYGIE